MFLSCAALQAVTWIDEGMGKRIRGVTFSARVSTQFENTMIHTARGIFTRLLPNIYTLITKLVHKLESMFRLCSPGYGISLVAETTYGCFVSADTAVSYSREDEVTEIDDKKKELLPPADVGEQIASVLLQEIEQGGVVDSRHQVRVVSALYYLFD
ncbi:hypothetical protein Tsubulata_012346 [Turnera subulata]|uniref:RNA 3'-terminal phosphate cyclase insert domain-containing protein n=1 Tax=Turnera subulata TaxID=218843 RepID=A0A9Q0F0U9_9ROSI|nr:hypothetical protein Tsubulata_012346 [Turnera subulata]